LLVGRVELRSNRRLDASQLGQVGVEISGPIAKLLRELTQFLGQFGPRIVGVRAVRLEVPGDLLDLLGLASGLLSNLLVLGDDVALRIRYEQNRNEENHGQENRDGRRAREPGTEQVARSDSRGSKRIGTLAPNEPFLVGEACFQRRCRLVDLRVGGTTWGRSGRPRGGNGEFEGAREPVAEAAFVVDRERRLAE
jgi:hypothetical protein